MYAPETVRWRPTPETLLAFAALFMALSGGAIALEGRDTVFSKDIVDGQVRPQDVAPAEATAVKENPRLDLRNPCDQDRTGVFCGYNVDSISRFDGWGNYGGYGETAFFRDHQGVVHLMGTFAQNGSPIGSPVFLLPPAYRPDGTRLFSIPCAVGIDSGVLCTLEVTQGGQVNVLASESSPGIENGGWTIDGVTFLAR